MGRVTIGDANLDDLLYISSNLRKADREEIFATYWEEDPKALADITLRCGDMQWIAYYDKVPVASFGSNPVWPNVWNAWAFGTDQWAKTVLSVTKHVRRFMLPAIFRSGAHRVQAYSHGDHVEAHKWLESFGANCEAVLVGFGSRRENFKIYAVSQDSVRIGKRQ